jgi:hypothetical protein
LKRLGTTVGAQASIDALGVFWVTMKLYVQL